VYRFFPLQFFATVVLVALLDGFSIGSPRSRKWTVVISRWANLSVIFVCQGPSGNQARGRDREITRLVSVIEPGGIFRWTAAYDAAMLYLDSTYCPPTIRIFTRGSSNLTFFLFFDTINSSTDF